MQIAFFSYIPLASSLNQSLSWGYIALFLGLPSTVISEQIIWIYKSMNPQVVQQNWNFNLVLWRSSQLYACSFAYACLSVQAGTITAYTARFRDGDNTAWSSFRISDDVMNSAAMRVRKAKKCLSLEYYNAVKALWSLKLQKLYINLFQPDFVTRYYAGFILLFNIGCILVSIGITNAGDFNYTTTTIIVCGLNIFLSLDIAMLLVPDLTLLLSRPIRLEYASGALAVVVIGLLVLDGTIQPLSYYLNLL